MASDGAGGRRAADRGKGRQGERGDPRKDAAPPSKEIQATRPRAPIMAPSTSRTLTMKLFIDTTTQRVLFAEAAKAVVDFLFSILPLTIANVVEVVGEASMAGSAGNLYRSVRKLDSSYILPGADRDALLKASATVVAASSSTPRLLEMAAAKPKSLYRCSSSSAAGCGAYVTDAHGMACPKCGSSMTAAVQLLQSAEARQTAKTAGKGLVQGVVTYTVRDDLTVTPMSFISGVTLLNTYGVRDVAALREKTVHLGYAEAVEILKASLRSKTVLTDVFLRRK